MVLFALSCFGLLLFLWLSFGGPIPLKPKGYQFKVAFPEATQLGLEADVRVAGVSVGKVRDKTLDPAHPNRTVATIEVDPQVRADRQGRARDPAPEDAAGRDLRRAHAGQQARGGHGARRRLPRPTRAWPRRSSSTRSSRRSTPRRARRSRPGSRTSSKAVAGRGRDLNDALGNLPAFADDGNDLLTVLDGQAEQVSGLVRNTGVRSSARSPQDEGQLHNLIVNAGRHLRRHLAPAGGAGRRRSRSSRPSSTSPRRPSSAWSASPRTPTRSSRTCARPRAT